MIGTVGRPGSRSFYLQARDGARAASISLEKEQSALLGEKVNELLDELMALEGNPSSVPAHTPIELVDNDPLDQPVEPEFRTGVISLGWDATTSQIVIEAYPIDEDEDDDEEESVADEPPEMMVVRIPVGTARAFAQRAIEVVGAGRSICPLCGEPMDPDGHRHIV